LAEPSHVYGTQSKAPSAGVSAGFVPEPPLDILEAERSKQNFVAIAQKILAGCCGHNCIGNRGVTIAVVVVLSGFIEEHRS
jgi:hypothetical protein